jgi:hypothetical protein
MTELTKAFEPSSSSIDAELGEAMLCALERASRELPSLFVAARKPV